jgi:hypothetical protein
MATFPLRADHPQRCNLNRLGGEVLGGQAEWIGNAQVKYTHPSVGACSAVGSGVGVGSLKGQANGATGILILGLQAIRSWLHWACRYSAVRDRQGGFVFKAGVTLGHLDTNL